jgi:hypothetical protein
MKKYYLIFISFLFTGCTSCCRSSYTSFAIHAGVWTLENNQKEYTMNDILIWELRVPNSLGQQEIMCEGKKHSTNIVLSEVPQPLALRISLEIQRNIDQEPYRIYDVWEAQELGLIEVLEQDAPIENQYNDYAGISLEAHIDGDFMVFRLPVQLKKQGNYYFTWKASQSEWFLSNFGKENAFFTQHLYAISSQKHCGYGCMLDVLTFDAQVFQKRIIVK